MLLKDAIIKVLTSNVKPCHYSIIADKIKESEEFRDKFKDLSSNVYATILNDIKTNKDKSPFVKTKRGVFGLNTSVNLDEYELLGVSIKRKATEFETKIRDFLLKLDFKDVDGARDNFIVGGHQVDVCAGQDNALLIIECKMAGELQKKNLNSIICELKGKINDIQDGFKKMEKYKKYTYFRFILAINDKIVLRPKDLDCANRAPNVYIWTEDFVEYYMGLYEYLEPHAKYNMLGEMNIKPVVVDPIQVPAFQTVKNGKIMYSFLIEPKELLKVTYVARREVGGKNFYQRIIKKERLNKIREYINKGGTFPNNIIIAFDQDKDVYFRRVFGKYSPKKNNNLGVYYGILEFPRDYRSCWVIDGQHRLYSFAKTEKENPIQVTAFQNMGINEQGKLFLDVNKNQKPVPPDLVWDLNGELTPDSEDGIISRGVKALNSDENGPLFHRIYLPSIGLKKRYLSLLGIAGICLSIRRAGFGRPNTKSRIQNPFFNTESDKHVKSLVRALTEYFGVVKEIFKEDWKKEKKGFVLDDGGASIIIRLFEKIVKNSIDKNEKLSQDYYEKYLSPVKEYLEKEYSEENKLKIIKSTYFSSESSKERLLDQLCLVIRNSTGDVNFGGNIVTNDLFIQMKSLERELGNFIEEVLKTESPEWIKNRIPGDILIRLDERKKQADKNYDDHRERLSEHLTFGEERKIIERKDNFDLFKEYFIGGPEGFGNKELFFGALDMLSKYRNQAAHDKLNLPPHKEKQIDLWITNIMSCIKKSEEEDEEEESKLDEV